MVTQSYILRWVGVCKLHVFVYATLFLLTLSGCAKVDLVDFPHNKGHVVISPNNSQYNLSGITYHFYPSDASGPTILSCNEKGGLLTALTPSSYCVLGTNLNASGVAFDGLNDRNTAIATVHNQGEATRATPFLSQPGDLFSVCINEFSCVKRDTTWHYPTPALLTKRILFSIVMDEALKEKVTSISAVLREVYPSVHLFTNETSTELTGAVAFDIPVSADYTAEVSMFGVRDPEHGSIYHNELALVVTLADEVKHLTPDISHNLSEAMAANGGALPLRLSIEIKLDQREDLSLSADVTPWDSSGTGEGIIKEEDEVVIKN